MDKVDKVRTGGFMGIRMMENVWHLSQPGDREAESSKVSSYWLSCQIQ